MKTVYDEIRLGKFQERSYMRASRKLLKEKGVVLNWWCRQAGKTTFSIYIAREKAREEICDIIFISHCKKSADFLQKFFVRAAGDEVSKEVANQVILKNGSRVSFFSCSSEGIYLRAADMIVFDEFDFFNSLKFSQLLSKLKPRKKYNLWEKLKIRLGLMQKEPLQELIFNSTMKDGANLGVLFSKMKSLPVSRVNFQSIPSHDPEEAKRMLGEEGYKKNYDSYDEEK